MGYGHLRAAAARADHWETVLVEADREPFADATDRLVWSLARRGYHSLSRLSQRGAARTALARLLDRITAIDDDELAPDPNTHRPVRILDTLIRRGFGKTLGHRLDRRGAPAVATFYANAIAAERHSSVPVACVVTDSHVHRVWVERRPETGRIRYLVPVPGTQSCLIRYGVSPDRIRVTGFPLPPELVGSPRLEILERNLSARLSRLRCRTRNEAKQTAQPLRLAVAVGGAGAHADHARDLLHGLDACLRTGRLRLTLVAGTHRWVARRFARWTREAIGRGLPAEAVEILADDGFLDYYRRFNRLLADTDILWTKPSELVFYAGLGLPLILEAPVGDHERHNRALVTGLGVAVDRPPSDELDPWLSQMMRTGWFAGAARRGRDGLDARATHTIASYCSSELYGEFTQG
jgi:hypothetical protein